MRPSDAPQVKASLNKLSADARRSRFFASIAEFSDDAVHRLIDIDPAREYLLVVLRREEGAEIPIAGGRFVHENERPDCTFSLLIGDPWQGQGIGRRILKALIREASRRGLRRMHGHVLADNRPMLGLARAQRSPSWKATRATTFWRSFASFPIARRGPGRCYSKTLATIGAPRAWQRRTGGSDCAKVCCPLAVSVR
jgi:GNAT superfamily N-acetyltransferase